MIIDTIHNVGDEGLYARSTQDCWCATIIGIECNCSDKCIDIWYKVFIPAFDRVRRIRQDDFYLSKEEVLEKCNYDESFKQ